MPKCFFVANGDYRYCGLELDKSCYGDPKAAKERLLNIRLAAFRARETES